MRAGTKSLLMWNAGLGLLALAGVLAAYWLVPSRIEKIEMLIADHHYQAAHRSLMAVFEEGSRDPFVLVNLTRTARQFGDTQLYVKALTALVAERPDDPVPREELLEYYRRMDIQEAYFDLLHDSLERLGKPAFFADLAAQYRLSGETVKELEVLATYMDRGNVSALTLRRAILLLAKDGRPGEALATYRRFRDLPVVTDLDWQVKSQVFRMMVQAGNAEAAVDEMAGWIAVERDDSQGLRAAVTSMSTALSRAGRIDLLKRLAETSHQHFPMLALSTGHSLAKVGFVALARDQIEEVIRQGVRLSAYEASDYVSILVEIGELDVATNYLEDLNADAAMQDAWAMLLGAAIVNNRSDLATLVHPRLEASTFEYYPLLEAQTAYALSDLERARQLLENLNVVDLDGPARAAWFYLMRDTHSIRELIARMQHFEDLSMFPREVRFDYAKLIQSFEEGEFKRVWRTLGGAYLPTDG